MGLDGFEYLKKQDIKEQVFQQLLSKIQSGEWKPGEKLPSENELTKAMGVSRHRKRSYPEAGGDQSGGNTSGQGLFCKKCQLQ